MGSNVRACVPASAPLPPWMRQSRDLVYSANGPVPIRAEDTILFGFWRGKRLRAIEPRLKHSGNYELATVELFEGKTLAPTIVRRLTREAVALNKKLGDPRAAAKSTR